MAEKSIEAVDDAAVVPLEPMLVLEAPDLAVEVTVVGRVTDPTFFAERLGVGTAVAVLGEEAPVLAYRYRLVKRLGDALEAARKHLQGEIEARLLVAGRTEEDEAVTAGPFGMRLTGRVSTRISRDRLLEQGVSAEVIERATVRAPSTHAEVRQSKRRGKRISAGRGDG